jgi:hypothetical protein
MSMGSAQGQAGPVMGTDEAVCHFADSRARSHSYGARGSVVVKTLCYKPEGHGFETR